MSEISYEGGFTITSDPVRGITSITMTALSTHKGDKDKDKGGPSKSVPKDALVIMAIFREMGIFYYDPKCVLQLIEFVYKYATSILEEARMYANNNSKKKVLDVDDVRLAIQLTTESSFRVPPPRELIMQCANIKNYPPLPPMKAHYGLRLPPDRHCLTACNYAVRSPKKKTPAQAPQPIAGPSGIKIPVHKSNLTYVKKAPPITVAKQAVTLTKPVTKIAAPLKTTIKPKIIISSGPHNVHPVATTPTTTSSSTTTSSNNGVQMDIENASLKRKREDESTP